MGQKHANEAKLTKAVRCSNNCANREGVPVLHECTIRLKWWQC